MIRVLTDGRVPSRAILRYGPVFVSVLAAMVATRLAGAYLVELPLVVCVVPIAALREAIGPILLAWANSQDERRCRWRPTGDEAGFLREPGAGPRSWGARAGRRGRDAGREGLNGAGVKGVPGGDGELAIGLACLTRNTGAIQFAPVHAGHWLVPDDAIAAAGTLDEQAAEPLGGALARVLSGTEGRRYARAQPGTDLNLAPAELTQLAATTAQGTSPARSAVVRDLALARYRAYRNSGLAGLAPYARSRGATMDPGAALRRSTLESSGVQKYFAPMHATLLNYPRVEPAVRDEGMHWIVARLGQRDTLLLTHSLAYHDGVAEIRAARALYVSQGLNATQAVTVVYPVAEGTLFMYVYRAWIDRTQVAGNSFAGRVARDLLTREMRELSRQTGTCS
jgi:hypothetical protein